MPNNCVFLVDTYDTLDGVKRAIRTGQRLREKGYEMVGIRLDSGDLAQLSIDARKILDEAGFDEAAIVASNDLNEALITGLKEQGATINVWGVGTKLATAYEQPALGGVYKLAAIRDPGEEWRYRVKLSNEPVKVSNPGLQQVRRFSENGQFRADVIYDERLGIPDQCQYNPIGETTLSEVTAGADHEDLLVPVFEGGRQVYETPDLEDVRQRTQEQLARLPDGSRQLFDPVPYTVGLEKQLHELKLSLMERARQGGAS
ncbi:MAG: nicotinate phosphoribosyltransferase, partial [Planctomycetota bacterium]|nr:nicotinate phosphoribosyltransferase [Planctomycetota bacterium]